VDWQYLANGLFTVVGVLLTLMYQSIKKDIETMKADIHEIDKLVSGEYIKRTEVQGEFDKLDAKLEKIFDKLNSKADK